VATGRAMLEKELQRIGLTEVNFEKLARQMNIPKAEDFFAAFGRNDIKTSQVVKVIQSLHEKEEREPIIHPRQPTGGGEGGVTIEGVGNLLTQIANCCKPLPGDEICGYITRGRGVTIHRQDCPNILRYINQSPERLVEVAWGEEVAEQVYPVDIQIKAFDRQGLLRDVASTLSSDKVNIIAVNTITDKKRHIANMTLTLEINDLDELSRLLQKIDALPNVLDVKRKG